MIPQAEGRNCAYARADKNPDSCVTRLESEEPHGARQMAPSGSLKEDFEMLGGDLSPQTLPSW